ncbi:MAG: diguanylate cyclase domain-containing protein [Bilifractor sp.]
MTAFEENRFAVSEYRVRPGSSMQAAEELQFYKEVVADVREGVYGVDQDRRIVFWNRAAEHITGYRAEEVTGLCCHETNLHHLSMDGEPLCLLLCPLVDTMLTGKRSQKEVTVLCKDGSRLPIVVCTHPVVHDGRIIGGIETFYEQPASFMQEDILKRIMGSSYLDHKTGIANRATLNLYINTQLKEFRKLHRPFFVIYADIDGMRHVNETYGKEAGDLLLKTLAQSAQTRLSSDAFIGHWDSDRLVVVLPRHGEENIRSTAEKLRALAASTTIIYQEHRITATISSGVTLAKEEDSVGMLMDRVQRLCEISRKNGGNCVTEG